MKFFNKYLTYITYYPVLDQCVSIFFSLFWKAEKIIEEKKIVGKICEKNLSKHLMNLLVVDNFVKPDQERSTALWAFRLLIYRKVASSRPVYYSIFDHFGVQINRVK